MGSALFRVVKTLISFSTGAWSVCDDADVYYGGRIANSLSISLSVRRWVIGYRRVKVL
jgi:hypothetical protein